MHSAPSIPLRRVREIVFGLCAAWLVMQNLILFAVFAWRPLGGLGLAALVLMRVALRAATPVTLIPGAGLLDVACALIPAALGVHHG
jgi:hypothetical protein